ncbi:hypothetical protein ABH909_002953 [Pseudomonas sp. BS3782 TE3695]
MRSFRVPGALFPDRKSKRFVINNIPIDTPTPKTNPCRPNCGSASANTRQNAANEYIPVAVALSNAAVNAGPRVCWENTAITLPSTGNTASSPLSVFADGAGQQRHSQGEQDSEPGKSSTETPESPAV